MLNRETLPSFLLTLLVSVLVWGFWVVLTVITVFAVVASFLIFAGVVYRG